MIKRGLKDGIPIALGYFSVSVFIWNTGGVKWIFVVAGAFGVDG